VRDKERILIEQRVNLGNAGDRLFIEREEALRRSKTAKEHFVRDADGRAKLIDATDEKTVRRSITLDLKQAKPLGRAWLLGRRQRVRTPTFSAHVQGSVLLAHVDF
jgi:hypothetical protein